MKKFVVNKCNVSFKDVQYEQKIYYFRTTDILLELTLDFNYVWL